MKFLWIYLAEKTKEMDTGAAAEEPVHSWCWFSALVFFRLLGCVSVWRPCRTPSPLLAYSPVCTTHPSQFRFFSFSFIWSTIPSSHVSNPHVLLNFLLFRLSSLPCLVLAFSYFIFFCSIPSFCFAQPHGCALHVKKGSLSSPPAALPSYLCPVPRFHQKYQES